MTVLFLSPDLMFSSRLMGAARTLGVSLGLVPNADQLPQQLTADCRLLIVDLAVSPLDLPVVVALARKASPSAKVIAFGAHVDEAALAAAQAAGCDQVFSRGQFHKQYVELLTTAAGN